MKKIICKREYDTDTAKVIKKVTSGTFGDPAGFETTLYETPEGRLFMYFNGGETSPYPTETIKSISKEKADLWLAENN